MKVLQITSHLNVGGITRYVLALSKQLMERGHQIIIAADNGSLQEQVTQHGFTYCHLPLHTSAEFSPQVFWGIRYLSKQLEKEPVDVIHAHTRVAQVVADRISRQFQIPYVTTWHGVYTTRWGRRLWPCTGDLTIAISGLVRQHLIHDFRIPEERVRLVYNGIDFAYYSTLPEGSVIANYRRQWQILQGRPVIGGIGRLAAGRVKGFDTLLAAVHLLKETLPEIQVLIVGDGPRMPFLEDVVRRLGIRDQVHFVGTAQDIRIALALMDLFIFTSRWPEAFGLTVVEAMAAGKMVIATQVGAVPEIIRHGLDGWIIPSDDPVVLAECVRRFLTDRKTVQEFGRQAQMRVAEAFSLDRMASEIEKVYREALGIPIFS